MNRDVMFTRLVVAIFSTLLEEAALVVIVLFGLPQIDINIPIPGLIGLMVAWGVVSVLIYRMGSRALKRKPVPGLSDMIESKGKVVSPLTPNGVVRIKGELWDARATGSRKINTGEEVVVIGQDGLKLVVRKIGRKKR